MVIKILVAKSSQRSWEIPLKIAKNMVTIMLKFAWGTLKRISIQSRREYRNGGLLIGRIIPCYRHQSLSENFQTEPLVLTDVHLGAFVQIIQSESVIQDHLHQRNQ